uniref:ATP synthase complex subunit 8 n=1 Tax=Mesophleps albilinella TaxID=1813607 RepID=A0A142CH62_9NEOP|nr:ATP synthase F0 subunit 8 [Mesophleps albilinella]AMP87969.1 ATP synthase F0 subunit 8 [Mesophleps albilinella]
MPQMMPINWMISFFIFIFIFILFNIMNYYIFNYSPLKMKNKILSIKNKNFSWKW